MANPQAEKLTQVSIGVLQQPQLLEQLEGHLTSYVLPQNDVQEALEYLRLAGSWLSQAHTQEWGNRDYLQRYRRLYWLCRFLALEFASANEQLELFRSHFVDVLVHEEWFEIWPKLRATLLGQYTLEQRDDFKLKVRRSLEDNREVLTSVPLQGLPGMPPTVQAWLRDYRGAVGIDTPDPFKIAEYFSSGLSVRKLKPSERSVLQRLTRFYDRLGVSSLTPEGFEEPIGTNIDGQEITLHEGEIEQIDPRVAQLLVQFKEKGLLEEALPETILRAVQLRPIPFPTGVVANEIASSQLQPASPTVMQRAEPALVFDLEDEREADNFRIKNKEFGIFKVEGATEEELRAFAESFTKQQNLTFRDDTNRRRFLQLVVSHLKGVRSIAEVREALLKPVDAGGLGMVAESAERVVELVARAKQTLTERGLPRVASVPIRANLPVAVPAPALPAKPAAAPPFGQPPVAQTALAAGPATAPKVPEQPAYDAARAAAWRNQVLGELAARAAAPPAGQAAANGPAAPMAKPSLVDVKAPPRVVGPLEELKTLSLVDFRRLDPSSVRALEKIRTKIDLIGETSVARRLEAVRAWQASPIYGAYLRIGRSSIEQGKTVAQVAAEFEAAGTAALTADEFNAVIDFNVKLRF